MPWLAVGSALGSGVGLFREWWRVRRPGRYERFVIRDAQTGLDVRVWFALRLATWGWMLTPLGGLLFLSHCDWCLDTLRARIERGRFQLEKILKRRRGREQMWRDLNWRWCQDPRQYLRCDAENTETTLRWFQARYMGEDSVW